MRRARLLSAILLLGFVSVFAQTSASTQNPGSSTSNAAADAAGPGDESAIQQIEDDWLQAERHTNPAALEKILSDDFVNLAPNGPGAGKSQLLKNWEPHAGQAPAYTVEAADMRIYIWGDSAVAAFTKTYTAKENGNVVREDTTHVFTRDHGTWKMRLSRSSFR